MITRRGAVLILGFAAIAAPSHAAVERGPMQPVMDFDWRFAADTVMGGVSEGHGSVQDGILRLTGTVSTANNGGFIQVRTELPDGAPPGSGTIHLRVRGNGERYFVHLRSVHSQRPWQSYRAGFETSADWSDVTLPLTAFAPSRDSLPPQIGAADIRSLGLVAYGRDHMADLSVSHIGFGPA